MNGSKSSIDDIIKFLNEKGVNPKTGWSQLDDQDIIHFDQLFS